MNLDLFSRLSTGIKMLIILSAALLPLGMIALFTSLESAQSNRLSREAETRLVASESARRLNFAVAGGALGLRREFTRPAPGGLDPATCLVKLDAIRLSFRYAVDYGLFDAAGRKLCATAGLSQLPVSVPAAGIGTEVRAFDGPELLRFTVARLSNGAVAVGELHRPAIADLTRPYMVAGNYAVQLRQGDAILELATNLRRNSLDQMILVSAPVAGGQLSLELSTDATPIRAIEILMILLPILMWLAAAIIGWIVVDRLLVRPLVQMQKAIANYSSGDGPLILPPLTTPSRELRALGDSFSAVTRSLSDHEVELEQGLARQTKLTREVHHRVKNNLQVVSSLINLHSRGVENVEAARAYASIQRRVDALAVVHRNHYAELEENRGVSLRALVSELASNLRATAPQSSAQMAMTLELMPAFASQDVAVPVAFLVTELVELVMICDPSGRMEIRLRPGSAPARAELSFSAPGLAEEKCRDHPSIERFSRVLEGLARQLRAPLRHDPFVGVYAIEISIVPLVEAG